MSPGAAHAFCTALLLAVFLHSTQCRSLPTSLPGLSERQDIVTQSPTPIPTPNGTPTPSPDPVATNGPTGAPATGTIWGIVSSGAGPFDGNGGDYDILARAVQATNYADILTSAHGGTGVTLFAPNDNAFLRTARELGYSGNDEEGAYNSIVAVLTNFSRGAPEQQLFNIVGYHILPGAQNVQLLRQQTPVSTYQGSQIVIENLTLKHVATRVSDPTLVNFDRIADNGLIHDIDAVLLPFDVDPALTRSIISSITLLTNNATGGGRRVVCFPASAPVLRADGTQVSMQDVAAGEEVRVTGRTTSGSAVYLFTHREMGRWHEFVRIVTHSEEHVITISPEHYMYANSALERADKVRVGDIVRTVSGPRRVAAVTRVVEEGLFAPHTLHGDIVVGGIVASTYTALFPPQVAHALLAPVRAVFAAGLAQEPLGDVLYDSSARFDVGKVLQKFLGQTLPVLSMQVRSG